MPFTVDQMNSTNMNVVGRRRLILANPKKDPSAFVQSATSGKISASLSGMPQSQSPSLFSNISVVGVVDSDTASIRSAGSTNSGGSGASGSNGFGRNIAPMAATQENSKVLKVQELVMDFRQFNAPGFLMGIFDPAELTVTLRPGFHKECPVSDAKPVKEIVWDQSSQEWQTRFSISSHTVVCTILNVLECVQLSMAMMGFEADMGEMLYSRLLEQAILDPDPEPDEPFTPLNMSFSPPLLEIDNRVFLLRHIPIWM